MEKLKYYWAELKKRPLAYNLTQIAGIILVLAIVAHIVMLIGTRHGARCTVPDFSGVRYDQAVQLARQNDLNLQINDSLFVPAYEGGIILDQLPEKNVTVKPGRTVYITINSFQQKMVPVPYVAGRSLRQAKNMLEIAGLEIKELIYRADMATNYVLEEYSGKQQISPSSKVEAEMGSGITLYVGAEGGSGRTVVPQLVGYSLKQAKSRIWELGLNIGRIDFDNGINLLNQKDARVYIQIPGAERAATLGARVDLRLTLDQKKLDEHRTAAEKSAATATKERLRREQQHADSVAQGLIEADPAPSQTETENDDNGFF